MPDARISMCDRDRLAEIAAALFSHDGQGRLTGDAPHVHILRSSGEPIVRCHADLGAEAVEAVADIAKRPRGRPREWADGHARLIERLTVMGPLRSIRAGLIYAFPDAATSLHGGRLVDVADAGLLLGGLDEWHRDALDGVLMATSVVEGQAVAVCASVASSAVVHLAGVETLPSFRGEGHAARAVAAWARAVRVSGATPFYGTTFDNTPSQRLAARLGLDPIASEFSAACDLSCRRSIAGA